MATITKMSDDKFRVQVRIKGHPTMAETFAGKNARQEAMDWGRDREREIEAGKKVGSQGKTGVLFSECVEKYLAAKPDIAICGAYALKAMAKFMKKTLLTDLTEQHVIDYIESREFSPATGAFHFSYLRSMLKMAEIGWRYSVPDILDQTRERLNYLGLIGKSKERDRRPTDSELDMLLSYKWTKKIPMADIIRFAISTTMRRAEILRVERKDFDKEHKTILIKDRKHPTKKQGNDQVVPLLEESMQIIARQKKNEFDTRIFPYNMQTVSDLFTDTCVELGIIDLHFHDLRHEAISRLFEMGYQIHEVAMFSGHDDWKNLKRYTQLKAKDLRRLSKESEATAEVKQVATPIEGDVMDAETAKQFKQFQAMMAMMKQTEAA